MVNWTDIETKGSQPFKPEDKKVKKRNKTEASYSQDECVASKYLLATAASGYLKLPVNLTALLKFALIRRSLD